MEMVVKDPDFIKRSLRYLEGTVEKLKALKPRDFLKMEVFIPCLEEQQKIAEFFATIDKIITISEAEASALEKQKKGAMQMIFSQEVRFKRNDGADYPEWKKITFENLFTPLNNNTFSRDMLTYDSGEVMNIHYGDILTKFGEICDVHNDGLPFVKEGNGVSKYELLRDGDIILADTAEDETVGKAIEIYDMGNIAVISGLHTMACRPTIMFAPKYLGYYMNSFAYHRQLFPFMQGIKVTSIGRKNIAN